MAILRLGYLGLRSPDPQGWVDFGTNVLGTPLGDSPDNDTVRLRVDRRPFAISIRRGAEAGLDYLGWETPDVPSVETVASHLGSLGIEWSRLSAETCRNRGVDSAISFMDPFDYTHEVYAGTRALARPLRPTAMCSGLRVASLALRPRWASRWSSTPMGRIPRKKSRSSPGPSSRASWTW